MQAGFGVTTDQNPIAQREYAFGQRAFERGRYREAVEYLEQAMTLAKPSTPLGGEIQTWLVNAYVAVGRQSDAIALCEKICRHPTIEVRKQAKNLLYILKAPRLKLRPEWMSRIPDLAAIADEGSDNSGAYVRKPAPKKRKPKPKLEDKEPIDWSQINTKDNGFLWVALGGVLLMLAGFVWF